MRGEDEPVDLGELLVRLTGRERWRRRAACRDHDPQMFAGESAQATRRAREVCRECPVIGECLQSALAHEETGVWGGTSEDERRALRGGDRPAAVPTPTPERAAPTPAPKGAQPCGTPAMYQRHRRRGEEACDACLEAQRRKSAQAHQRRRERRAKTAAA